MVSIQKMLEFFRVSAQRSKIRTIFRGLAVCLCMSGSCYPLAGNATTYTFTALPWGDTAGPVDINDHGVVVFSGFGDNGQGGNSRIVGGGSVQGFGYLGIPSGGVRVSEINNAGDMRGTAMHNDIWVPTIWHDGLPYDLTEPANSGLTFNVDPGPQWTYVDLWALDVLGEPFVRDPFAPPCCHVLTNQRGDYVAAFRNGGFPGYDSGGSANMQYALLTQIPEPATLALFVVALLGLAATRRRRRITAYQNHNKPGHFEK